MMTVLEQMNCFADRFGKQVIVSNVTWHYYATKGYLDALWKWSIWVIWDTPPHSSTRTNTLNCSNRPLLN